MGSASVAVAGALFSFVFMRSSKDLPRTLPELKAELAFQWLGFTGVLEDHMMRFKNQTSTCVCFLLFVVGNRLNPMFDIALVSGDHNYNNCTQH